MQKSKMPRVLLLLITDMFLIVTLLAVAPDVYSQVKNEQMATVKGAAVAESGKPLHNTELVITLRGCRCASCVKDCDCCPPTKTIKTDRSGHFVFDVPPGKYTIQIKDKDSTKVDVDLSPREKKTVTIGRGEKAKDKFQLKKRYKANP